MVIVAACREAVTPCDDGKEIGHCSVASIMARLLKACCKAIHLHTHCWNIRMLLIIIMRTQDAHVTPKQLLT